MALLESCLAVLHSLAALGLIALASFGFGRPIVRRLHVGSDPLASGVWSVTLGLLAAGTIIALLAARGGLSAAPVAGVTLVGVLCALVELACLDFSPDNRPQGEQRPRKWQLPRVWRGARVAIGTRPAWLVLAPGGAVLLAGLLMALVPPLSSDAFTRSLEVAKRSLEVPSLLAMGPEFQSGQHQLEPHVSPLNLTRAWYLWAMVLEGPVAARLMNWGLGLLTALAGVMLARLMLPTRTAWLAGGFVATCPGFIWQLAAPREELAVALMATLSLVAVLQLVLHGEWRFTAVAGGLALAGTIAASPVGFLWAAAASLALAIEIWTRRAARQQLAAGAALLFATAALAAVPWLWLSAWSWPSAEIQSPLSAATCLGPLAVSGLSAVVVVRRLRGVPLLLRFMGLGAALAMIAAAHHGWWTMFVGPTCVIAVWMWQELATLPARAQAAMTIILGALLAISPLRIGWSAIAALPVASGWQSRDEYLLAHEPTYRAASLINQIARSSDRLYCEDARTFYFSQPTAGPQHAKGESSASVDDPRGTLTWAANAGFSYVVLTEAIGPDSTAATGSQEAEVSRETDAIQEMERSNQVIPILEYRFADDNNRYIRYRLLKLRPAAIQQAQRPSQRLN